MKLKEDTKIKRNTYKIWSLYHINQYPRGKICRKIKLFTD